MPAADLPTRFATPEMRRRIELIAASHQRLTGRALIPAAGDPALALWLAPQAIVAHGVESDPLFFFGNRAALARFDCTADELALTPSRLTAEAPGRSERQALLDRVLRDGFVDDYAGVRVSRRGRRFRIEQATVWNLLDEHGALHGQAAAFVRATEL